MMIKAILWYLYLPLKHTILYFFVAMILPFVALKVVLMYPEYPSASSAVSTYAIITFIIFFPPAVFAAIKLIKKIFSNN